jgi:TonB family protein
MLLIVNSLPQDVFSIDGQSAYRYIVEFGAINQSVSENLSWTLIWAVGCLAILSLGVFAQWKVMALGQYNNESSASHYELKPLLPNRLKVASTKSLTGPVLSGFLKPTLLLPEGFTQRFSARQQQLMVNHELVHYHRGDNLYNLIALIFVAVFWFNPLTWLAYRAFRRSQELSCDAVVLKQANKQDKIIYSKALVQCAEGSLHSFSIYSPYSQEHTMFKRIKNIQTTTQIKPALVGLAIAIASTLIAGVAFANLTDTAYQVGEDVDATPVVRIEPKYPIEAAQNKQEGSVILQFDLAKDGSTENIQILESFPQQVFDKVSVTALKQWTYKPRVIGGQAQKQTGLTVQLDYRMNYIADQESALHTEHEKIKIQH